MRDLRRNKDLLGNMVEVIDYALEFAKGYDYDTFWVDKKTYFAVVKNIEIVGEAHIKLPMNSVTATLRHPGKSSSTCGISWYMLMQTLFHTCYGRP